ncbi:M14 family metallopeptidase [Pendulispora albinea]|uniref:M14 family metallopeptidase n=1 Tax=Pendulispora albinea TaxID=2741071 RepID=A0ABZ2LP13_9BACT
MQLRTIRRKSVLALSALLGLASTMVLVAGCSSDGAAAPEAPAEASAARGDLLVTHVYYKDQADLQRMVDETDLDVLEEVNAEEGWVAVLIEDAKQYDDLIAQGYRVDIVERESAAARKKTQSMEALAGIPGYSCYRTVEETNTAINTLVSDHPTLAKVVTIGKSWKKVQNSSQGYDLRVLKVTNSAIAGPKPVFFLMGAIHAREYTTAETALRFAEQMVNGYGTDADATWLLDHYELHVLPQTNPDGRKIAEQGYYQRKNGNNSNGGSCSNPPQSSNQYGTDLNRNSSYKYATGGSSSQACAETYRGPSAASEPETRAVQDYIASIFPDQRGPNTSDPAPSTATGVLITLHSYAQKVLYPWGWSASAPPNAAGLATLGRKLGFLNGYSACQVAASGCMYVASGGTDDWSYGELGVASYTIEMGTAFFESCSSFTSTVAPGNLAALRYAFKAARRPYQTPSGPDSLEVVASPSTVTAGAKVTLTAKAIDGRYSSTSEATQNIAAARYSVGAPSWVSGTTTVAMSASDGAFNAKTESVTASIDTSGWQTGRHIVLVESQDASGNWGVPSAVFINVQ